MAQSELLSFSATMAGLEIANERSLFGNLLGCSRSLQMIIEHHVSIPPKVGQYLCDLNDGIDGCASLVVGDPKKLYNVVLERLYQLKAEFHLVLKLYFNHTSPYWECFRFNVMEIRAILACCCAIPKLPIQKFQRRFVDLDKILRKRKWGPFLPDSPAVDRYLAHVRAEKQREKLTKMLIEGEHPKLEESSNAGEVVERNPLTLVKRDSDFFSIKIGSKSVSSTKKCGQKTTPSSEHKVHQSIRDSLREMRQTIRSESARAVKRQCAFEDFSEEAEEYF